MAEMFLGSRQMVSGTRMSSSKTGLADPGQVILTSQKFASESLFQINISEVDSFFKIGGQ